MSTTTTATLTTSIATLPKMSLFSNTLCNNKKSNNKHAPVLFLSSKSVSGDKISSGKVDESTSYMILKPTFVEEVDNDDNETDFEIASRVHFFSAGDNQTQELVMGHNITGLSSEQKLLGAELLKKNNLMNCCIAVSMVS